MIEIDGSFGESGGQIIRTSMTLSAITKKPVRIFNIRAGRSNPGLQMQHLTAVRAVRNICRGSLEGAELESRELIFHPGEIVGGRYEFDIGTAGSVTLVAQTLIPILLNTSKESEMKIIGGTHVLKSPGYDYFEKVFVPAIAKFGAIVETKMLKPGYFPKGGGIIDVKVAPTKLHGCSSWQQSNETFVMLRLSDLPLPIAIREKKIFVQNEIEKIFIRQDQAYSPGNAVTAWRGYRGAYVAGERGKRAEVVAQEVLDMLNSEKDDVDLHLADQLLIYAALAEGQTAYKTSKISDHLRTNAAIITKFIEREIKIKDNEIIC
ncbi:RNA 3'-terminal phosphate cyclase [Candidatus Bilamarchaeum dharawalense]|uniref:RNA 3'-terminal phosphate cyclase n=1 Tax=Candidatus Bilamarchaeum dharawalense TaxID=2885759 RepID=A0A5E4LYB5_9ARCH|nr:RNA 3'-terminal phosphate cyclase [Candidatus Bilamarchaeum dharawalense]